QPAGDRIGLRVLTDLVIQGLNSVVQPPKIVTQVSKQNPKKFTQPVFRIFQPLGDSPAQGGYPNWGNQSILASQSPNLVGFSCPLADQCFANTMGRLHILLCP